MDPRFRGDDAHEMTPATGRDRQASALPANVHRIDGRPACRGTR